MNIIRYIICFLLIQSHGLFSQDYSSIRKKTRLAIFSILDKTNQNYSDGSELNLDKRLYDKLESELVNSEKFILVDRNKIESIMQEQSIQQTGIISDQSATSLGKLLGVQLAIFGSLNDIFQEADWVTNEGKVSLDAGLKIIDIKTGEIVLAENELVSVVLSQNPGDEFSRSGVSNVVLKTAEIFTQKILLEGNKIPWEARITNVLPGGKVVLNAGMADGIKIGLVFHIYSLGDEIVDPSTGLSFGFVESYSGEIIVLKNDLGGGKASLCEVTASENTINNSDVVKIPENVAVPIYRFYHKKNKDHFYTKNSTPKGDWIPQGIEFYAYAKSKEGTVPIYRYYHKKNKDHFYSKNAQPKGNWIHQGIEFYAYAATKDGTVPIYRFYHKKNKDHFYSKNANPKGKWNAQGIEFYALPPK